MLSFGTPNGLGIEGITPSGLNLPTPGLGGAAMMPSMSELGLTVSGAKRNEDDERRTKMRSILKSIGKPKGRVSEEGIARICRRVGFANDIDADKLKPDDPKVGNRVITTAGNTTVIEIDLRNQVPCNVQVAYSVQSKALDEQGEKASKVLLKDLKAPDGVALQTKLDRFARNLENLARLDRLSLPGVNCFEALAGVYTSLRRLYEQEKAATKALLGGKAAGSADTMDKEVMCRKSGRPMAHERNKLGLAIEYWQSTDYDGREETEAEADGRTRESQPLSAEKADRMFTLRIEAEAASANLYPALRISETWLPDPLDLTGDINIPWQVPPPTFVAADAGDIVIDGQQKLPDLRFIAKLEPPVVMPYQTAMNILAAVGVTQAPIMITPPSQYAALLLGQASGATGGPQSMTFSVSADREVLSYQDEQETTVRHCYTLSSVKPDWGFTLAELPFSHPRQVIELLPTLRQWACTSQLLKATFKSQALSAAQATVPSTTDISYDDSLDDLLDAPPETDGVPITIALATSPTPTFDLTFPSLRTNNVTTTSISVQILPNGNVTISAQEGLLNADAADVPAKLNKLAKALESCDDLGVWLEWLRTSITA